MVSYSHDDQVPLFVSFYLSILPFPDKLPLHDLQPADILLLPAQLVVERKPFLVEMLHYRLPALVVDSFSVILPAGQRFIRLPVLVQLKLMLTLIGAGLAAGEFAPHIVIPLVLLPVLISVYARAYRTGQLCVFLPSSAQIVEFRIM